MKDTLETIPLDVPIPTTEVFYLWYEPEGVWMSWDTYIDVAIFARNAERRRGGSMAVQPRLFEQRQGK